MTSRLLFALSCAAPLLVASLKASGAEPPAISGSTSEGATEAARQAIAFLPTVLVDGGVKRMPTSDDADLLAEANGLDAALADAAQDLGFSVDLTYRPPPNVARLGEIDLMAQARSMGGVLVAPSLEVRADGEVEVRLSLADARPSASSPRATRALRVRVERAPREDIAVRAVVMLRDLASEMGPATSSRAEPAAATWLGPAGVLATPARSEGRATLAINATLVGGLVGFSIHRASGSEDPRLLYPLLAVGAGIGLGGAMIVAEEWDVGVADAWYLVSGAWWPTIAGHLIFEGRFGGASGRAASSSTSGERWAAGLIGGSTGLAIATMGLTLRGMSEGGALLAHSGGGLGLVLGGLAELSVRGDIYSVPFAGMGYGAGLGWLVAAAAATVTRPSPGRVLTVDLGGILGGLGGAALGSPLLFGEATKGQQRAWLGIAGGGSLVGAGVAWYMTRGSQGASPKAAGSGTERRREVASTIGLPLPGVIGESVVRGRRAPVIGLSFQGALQ